MWRWIRATAVHQVNVYQYNLYGPRGCTGAIASQWKFPSSRQILFRSCNTNGKFLLSISILCTVVLCRWRLSQIDIGTRKVSGVSNKNVRVNWSGVNRTRSLYRLLTCLPPRTLIRNCDVGNANITNELRTTFNYHCFLYLYSKDCASEITWVDISKDNL